MSDTPPDLTPEQVSPEPAPKKRIIRKTKSAAEAPVKPQTAAEVPGTEQDSSPAPRKRTIRKKVAELADDGMESVDVPGKKTSRKSSAEIPVEEAQDVPARPRRGRPRKKPVEEVPETDGSAIVSGTEAAVKPVRRRAAKAVAPENGDSAGPEAEIAVHAAPAEPASDSSDSVPEQPAEGRPKVIRQRFVRKPREQEPEADASVPSIKVVQEGAADFSEDAAREPRRTNEPQRQRFDRQNAGITTTVSTKTGITARMAAMAETAMTGLKTAGIIIRRAEPHRTAPPVNWRRRNRWTGCWKLRIRGSAF